MKRILMASVVLTFFAAGMLLFQMSSCKKADAQTGTGCPSQVYPVTGLWEGTHLTDQFAHDPAYYSLAVYPDGSLLLKVKGVPPAQDVIYAKGRWILSGTNFNYTDTTLNYSSTLIQTGTATFNNTGTLTNGKWQDLTSDGGVFYTGTTTLHRIN